MRLIDQFCVERLNEEYAMLCRKMTEKLNRKRALPLLESKPNAYSASFFVGDLVAGEVFRGSLGA